MGEGFVGLAVVFIGFPSPSCPSPLVQRYRRDYQWRWMVKPLGTSLFNK
jgi:hypothetical protein